MKKQQGLSLSSFIQALKALVKPHYFSAMWSIGGITIIYFALLCVASLLMTNVAQSMMMSVMMIMYGMASPMALLLGLLEILAGLVIMAALTFFYSFFTVAVQYTYQDHLLDPDQPVSAGSIWLHFKHLRKNQLWRIALYTGLFIFLWSLPLDIVARIVGGMTHNAIWFYGIRIVNEIIVIWKGIEYAQAYFLYRDKQPQFLGQSMRHALTASRRFMGGRKWNYLLICLFVEVLPMVVWTVIFGGLAYYGNYTATYVLFYIGLLITILGLICYLPVVFATGSLFYVRSKETADVNADFRDTFKPVAVLTGEAFVHEVYAPKKEQEQPSPTVKPEEKKKTEAKKED
ncbi:hypothetical protein [Limosilactobacillus oris]|uniref:hypothetical protein n=1 Tax=Limosilactobacillus oris TaxID=1632 RepID=UPI0024BBE81A|nr:hypothetical protein [Limosilactobacillus oris]